MDSAVRKAGSNASLLASNPNRQNGDDLVVQWWGVGRAIARSWV